jgi:hypothetical protein
MSPYIPKKRSLYNRLCFRRILLDVWPRLLSTESVVYTLQYLMTNLPSLACIGYTYIALVSLKPTYQQALMSWKLNKK